jgi:NhaP-type Na+/H+ or K+/H+ antiporter
MTLKGHVRPNGIPPLIFMTAKKNKLERLKRVSGSVFVLSMYTWVTETIPSP